jgi:hypothetical protein
MKPPFCCLIASEVLRPFLLYVQCSKKFKKTDFLLPACDFRTAINKLVSSEWNANWDNAVFNKLHNINPSFDVSPSLSLSNRHDQTVLLRCRIGHTKVTHSYLLTNDNAPFCVGCNANFTVKHFLLECHDFSQTRNRFYNVNSLKELNVPS